MTFIAFAGRRVVPRRIHHLQCWLTLRQQSNSKLQGSLGVFRYILRRSNTSTGTHNGFNIRPIQIKLSEHGYNPRMDRNDTSYSEYVDIKVKKNEKKRMKKTPHLLPLRLPPLPAS